MTCQACKDKPRGKRCGSCGKLPPVLEVKTEECPILFHTVEVEGNIKDNPPEIGRFRNTLAVYKEDDYKILYNSDGIPSNLGNGNSISDFNDLKNRPKYAGEAMTGNTNIPDVADAVAGEATIREAADERLEGLIDNERTARQEADGGLQTQIDALAAASDVTDIVGTYADLQAYDTSKLKDNDIIKVLQDETHDDETTYYRWVKASSSFSLIGEEGPYYTKAAADAKFQDKLTAGPGITIDPDTNEISADGSETIFYANLSETGTTRHIYKDIDFTTAASVQDIIDANDKGQVILRGTSLVNPTAYSDSYLQNAFIMPHNNDFEFVFLDRDVRYEYSASATTDSAFYYYTSEIQPKLTAGTNVNISGTTISATDTTYSDFTGTDGTAAGTAGLVPAPATTDAGKYLKADGTWDTVSAGPNVVQTTGTSQTDVMSQAATSNMVFPSGYETSKTTIVIGKATYNGSGAISIGTGVGTYARSSGVAIGRYADASSSSGSIAIGGGTSSSSNTSASGGESIAIGVKNANASHQHSIALGSYSRTGRTNEFSIGSGVSGTAPVTRYIANVTDPELAQDATTKNYTDSLVISYSAINGASAPTTATEAKYVGQLYYDTTNDDLYYCSAITAQGTDPETYTYTWSQFGGGGPTVVQTIGTSTTDVMSQNAVRDMIYQPNTSSAPLRAIQIGDGTHYSGTVTNGTPVAIGSDAAVAVNNGRSGSGVAIGGKTQSNHEHAIALGYGSATGRDRELSVGGGVYLPTTDGVRGRYIANVLDPQLAHDAATKNYVDTRVLTNAGAPTTSTVGVVGQLLEDTTNGKLYQCTDATNPYVWTEVGAGGTIPTKTSDLINDGATGTSTYVEATDIADVVYKGTQITTTSPNIISTPMIQDGAVTAAKLGNDVNFLSLTMSTTDIGEGAPLAANTLYGVYQ